MHRLGFVAQDLLMISVQLNWTVLLGTMTLVGLIIKENFESSWTVMILMRDTGDETKESQH
jgi:hypothetical protein